MILINSFGRPISIEHLWDVCGQPIKQRVV